jgi:hypothetical protein
VEHGEDEQRDAEQNGKGEDEAASDVGVESSA